MNKITNLMVSNRHKKKRLSMLSTLAMAMFMALFTQIAQAQVNTGDNYQIYMKEGNSVVASNATNVKFYDDHGPSQASSQYVNYWDRWYDTDKHYTYVFRPKTDGDKIKVTFKKFHAYEWSNTEAYNCHDIGQFSLRINDDILKVYNSDGAVASNLIAELTGTIVDEFTFIADGAMTFEFISNEQYREEGWEAEVTAVSSLSVQAPIISRATCSNDIIITPTVPGVTIYYTAGSGTMPSNPTTSSTQYTAPFEWPVGYSYNVKAIAVLNGVSSSVTTKTFDDQTDRLPDITPLVPTIEPVEGTNTVRITCPAVPTGMNETFYVAYTTDNTEPSYNNGNKVFFVIGSSYEYPTSLGVTVHASTYEFDVTTPNTTVRAKTFAYSCSDLVSNEGAPLTITNIYVDAPTLSFTTTNTSTGAGTCTISDIMAGATVYYTTDGSTPTTSSTPYNGTPFTVTPGQTIKAIAHIAGEGYLDSPVVSDTYIPGGEGGSGAYGTVVVLDDREPHTWSYYTEDSPVHSLEPRDIKITYYGNSPAGRTTMTDGSESNVNHPSSSDFNVAATGVKVNHDADANQFIYMKTLEAANEDGSGNYPYTMIANPFQVRPAATSGSVTPPVTRYVRTTTITAGRKYLIVSQSNTGSAYALGHNGGNVAVDAVTISSGSPSNYIDASYVDATSVWTAAGDNTHTFQNGQYYIGYTTSSWGAPNNLAISTTSRNWTWSANNNRLYYDGVLNDYYIRYNNNAFSLSTNQGSVYLYEETTTGGEVTGDFRGFYAWRVKSLSDGLTIQRADGSAVIVDGLIDPEEEIKFVTSKENGNEVEFEALWAKAYVTTNGSLSNYVPATEKSARERNFFVLNGAGWGINGITVPATYTAYLPDGTNGNTSSSITTAITCSSDVRIENIILNFSNGTMNANGHNLHVGRGVTGTVNRVQGLDSAPTDNAQYTIRLESGTYNYVSWIKGYWYSSTQYYSGSMTISGTNNFIVGVLGSDYDRAMASTTGNNNLTVTGPVFYGYSSLMPNQDVSKKSLDVTIKSGKFNTSLGTNMGTADAHESIYMGIAGQSTNTGERKLTVEGGILASIAGGVDAEDNDGNRTFTLRMRNGTVNGAIYGAGAVSPAYGDRCLIITGGTVKGWIGAGCNGVSANSSTGGQTIGLSHVYVGGKTAVGGSATINGSEGGTVFGAGKGSGNLTTEPESGRMAYGSNVVIADEATISNNVYGGGNYGFADEYTKLYVLGGTVQGSVFGGSNQNKGPEITINMKGGTINGSLYGGSNTSGIISELATINVSGGTVTNVFGGGLGSSTSMAAGTKVNVSGGTINNNIYGGGQEGTVTSGGTQVNVSGGTVSGSVYGAGMGTTNSTAQISGQTEVNITGGTIAKSVYGGGQLGNVVNGTNLASKVTIDGTGVTINENVFGGGQEGYTTGKVVVNLFHGNIKGHLFGGALGKQGSVYVGGQKTVNITGGHVFGNVYCGSRNANDANALTGYNENEQATTCEINMSAGKIDQNLYGAGYFGHTYGSVNVYLGAEAISNAPNHTTIDGNINYTREGGLNIEGTVFAGSDWGDFTGNFGPSTVSGMSNIYVDGSGYNSTATSTGAANYMKTGVSILGCGTSNDAGTTGRTLIVRNYGTAVADAGNTANPFSTATRQLLSIQRFKEVIFDNAHLLFTGQGKVNSLNITEKYGLYEDETVYLSNGSTMITNVPCSQIKSFQSVTCGDTYATTPSFSAVAINGLGATGSATDNKIRVNGGSYIEVKYEADGVTTPYGELKGWAHMMSSINDQEATCAYARPKQSQETGNKIPAGEDNPNDGGFVSYDGIYNQYTADGTLVETGNSEQIRYENHTPNMTKGDSQYFRIWRYGGNRSNLELVFDAHATGTEGYRTVDVTITLPPFRSGEHYYRFETTGETPNRNTTTEYGSDVLTFNMAAYNTTLDADGVHGTPGTNGYMYYRNGQQTGQTAAACPGKTDIDDNPDVNFGLVIMPDNTSAVQGSNYIICDASDNYLAELNKPFTCRDNTQAPSFTFRLTYSNELSSNMTWDPMKVKLVQCDKDGNITDYVTLDLVVVTSTTIAQNFTTKVYAIMDGQGHLKDTYISKIILPTYNVQTAGENSTFTVKSVTFTPDQYVNDQGAPIDPPTGTNVTNNAITDNSFDRNSFGMAIAAADTYDNTNVWYSTGDGQIDVAVSPVDKKLGQESGRNEVGIDVVLFYSGLMTVDNESHMGTVNIEVEFDNYAEGDATNHKGTLHLIVEIYRLGGGENYYVDGVAGKDESGFGRNPDKPAATVNYIFNRCEYRPGGNIFVVNTVTVDKPETWNGARFNSVNMYRYPGVHKLSTGEYGDPSTNPAFTGKLVEVSNELTLRGIVMDGMYAEATATSHANTQTLYPSEHGCNFNGQSVAPLINVADGGRVNLKDGVVLQNNYNTTTTATETSSPGGALSVQYGGTARMNEDAQITANINGVAGGVWVDGTLIVSDHVQIFNNKMGTESTSRQSNVWLTEATDDQAKANVHYKVIQIGTSSTTDEYGPIENDVKIGVDKEDWGNTIDGFMPVVYAEDGTQEYLELPYAQPQTIIVHDANKYELEKYTDNHYLFWISTWLQKQDHQPTASAEDGGVAWDGIGNITTANQFAWLISLINGENGCTADDFAGKTIVVKNDLDLKAAIWVPITNFKGTLEGNGHLIQGLNSPLMKNDMGMFGTTNGATIQNVIAKVDFNGDAENIGTLIGTMNGGTLSNVEAAGDLEGKSHTKNMGGLVGKVESGTIHSSFSVNEMTTSAATTVMGGLVGTNAGNLYNSYANTTMSGATKMGGLVGVNDGRVENCYAVVGTQTFPAFANTNNGTITICYADTDNGYVTTSGDNATLSGHGTYDVVKDRKELGYLYGDNKVTAQTADTTYIRSKIFYDGGKIATWPGLVSTLNQWVNAKSTTSLTYTPWFRPITQDLNGDLPVLAFPKDNCLGNQPTADGKMLRYSACDEIENDVQANNGLDNLLVAYKDQTANIFLYGNAINVENVPTANVNVTVNEDAVLMQKQQPDGTKANEANFINTTVGVTFDNSCKAASDYFGTPLEYDWHLMSTPLADAKLGISYASDAELAYGNPADWSKVEDGYMPNMTNSGTSDAVTWDFYTYFEPEYHWINFKRSQSNHWHYDEPHYNIAYTGTEQTSGNLTPGRGYMMAISQDSYLNQTGTLNNGDVPMPLTMSGELPETETPSKDWGSNLVGNPYQTYLDLDVVTDETGQETFYVYDADNGTYGPYMTGASVNPAIPSKYIHPHQAFFVVTDKKDDAFMLTYKMATATKNNVSYFRGETQPMFPLVNLFVENEAGSRDLAIVEFNRPELGGVRKVDNLRNANFKLYAHYDGGNYGLLFTPEDAERVPVHFRTMEDGTFTLTWQTMHGTFTNLILVDNLTGVRTNMLTTDHYTFEGSVDDYAARFYITFNVTGVDELNGEDGGFAWFDGNDWIVTGKGQLDVIDVTGRVLRTERVSGEQTRLHLDGVAAGVYMMRLSEGNKAMTQKIVVK